MIDREKVVKEYENYVNSYISLTTSHDYELEMHKAVLALLKGQEEKQITLHKKHVIAWNRNDEFSMGKLYEAICETLLDEGELFIARTDDHEKVDFVFYVAEGGEME